MLRKVQIRCVIARRSVVCRASHSAAPSTPPAPSADQQKLADALSPRFDDATANTSLKGHGRRHIMAMLIEDEPAAKTVLSVLDKPLESVPELSWDDLPGVIAMADKYQLVPVLQACERFILVQLHDGATATDASDKPPFGVVSGTSLQLTLDFLELLCRARLHRAYRQLLPLYFARLECFKQVQDTYDPNAAAAESAFNAYGYRGRSYHQPAVSQPVVEYYRYGHGYAETSKILRQALQEYVARSQSPSSAKVVLQSFVHELLPN